MTQAVRSGCSPRICSARSRPAISRGRLFRGHRPAASTAAGTSARPTSTACWAGGTPIPVGTVRHRQGRRPGAGLRAPGVGLASSSRSRCGVAAMMGHVFSRVRRLQGREGRRHGGGRHAGAHARWRWRVAALVWAVLVVKLTGYVSLGSIAAAAVFPVAVYLLEHPDRAGASLDRRAGGRRASSGSTARTSGGCSRAPRTGSAAGRRRQPGRDARSPCWARGAGAPRWPICWRARARTCGSGPTSRRWWRRSTASTRTRCSCPAFRWRRRSAPSADPRGGGRAAPR